MWRVLQSLLVFLFLSEALSSSSFSPSEQEHRPHYHFLPDSNWLNDPNAPFFDEETGIYHLFYQWLTPRTWGHAISYNLVDWSILPMALNYSDSMFTEMPNSTAGVYSGSALLMPMASGKVVPWLSVSVPTNDMQLLAYPADLTDSHYTEWTYVQTNPVIYSSSPSASIPPGRDPTEVWRCGAENAEKWCLTYATQASEGCPCSGISGSVVFSATFDYTAGDVGMWSDWTLEGYLLNDTVTGDDAAVMWECTDLFPLVPSENIWLFKFSIGPGPSYEGPWGRNGPRDYYVTGVYKPYENGSVSLSEVSTTAFTPDSVQFETAMAREESASLDPGPFYASKSFLVPGIGRLLFGWLPEERPVDSHGNPYGWAGAMSLPRNIIPYQIPGRDGYYVRTPPLESAVSALHSSQVSYGDEAVSATSASESPSFAMKFLPDVTGSQLDISLGLKVRGMKTGDECGIRLRSSIEDSPVQDGVVEYTDVYVQFLNCSGSGDDSTCSSMTLSVDTTQSNSNMSISVNRSICTSGPIDYIGLTLDDHENETVKLRALLDHSVVETFLGAGGERAVTRRIYPSNPSEAVNVQLFTRCGADGDCTCQFTDVDTWTLRSSFDPLSSSGNNSDDDVDDLITYVVIAVIASILVVFFMWRLSRKKHLENDDEPLMH